ncbi:MAG: hypothetical protein GWO02_13460, partial [Gammaproteobacteria bacterium]|nr:hypothetical protein [Gammaproteobacteria bacterium]
MSGILSIAAGACLALGGAFVLIGGIGLLRMPSFFTRLHAAGVTDTLGAGLVLLGLALDAGGSQGTLKI